MPVRYSDGAKTFISAIFIGAVGLALVFLLSAPERKSQPTPPAVKAFTCDKKELDFNYVGYVNDGGFDERMKALESKKYEVYCIEKTGVRQWSIYAR